MFPVPHEYMAAWGMTQGGGVQSYEPHPTPRGPFALYVKPDSVSKWKLWTDGELEKCLADLFYERDMGQAYAFRLEWTRPGVAGC